MYCSIIFFIATSANFFQVTLISVGPEELTKSPLMHQMLLNAARKLPPDGEDGRVMVQKAEPGGNLKNI